MTIIDRPLRMPRSVFLALWHGEDLGKAPVVVEDTPMYLTEEGAAERAKRTRELLNALGDTADALRSTLRLLATARHEVYGWTDFGTHQEDNGAILVAATKPDAVRLITDSEFVQLDPVSPDELAACLVMAMPECPPAAVRAMRVSREYYDGGGSADPLAEEGGDADELRYLMRAPRAAVHQLHAAIRDGRGERRYSSPLSVIDLSGRGRVLSFQSSRDGEAQISVYPGNRASLIDAVNRTLTSLR
ncbi:ESX secretion-associated protein EspG [Amycolatopsis sp. FU40]|uniref:ESX secretion-associated protein EspG n=1 Tax=Amycolatopsis sp. FU40 TaxID=2914159 RepID=UPI001F35735B|nr:ESX secretion-associated protein EspG [Amycolatopsis sp. FU40]UKD54219.1 ESX secretion-associated protein EspG [Amycolatopsis sp. FU40]